MNPLNSVRGAITTGVVLALLAARSPCSPTAIQRVPARPLAAHRRGRHLDRPALLLQRRADPGLADAAADKGGPGGAGISKYVAPRALFWFRWAAVATWLTGFWYLACGSNLGAFTFGMTGESVNSYQLVIGIGAWLGTIMLFNVWGLIWPNQKKILGIVAATDEEKAKARKVALHRLAHELRAVDPDADVHGRRRPRGQRGLPF